MIYLTIGTVAEVAGTGNQHGIPASISMGLEGLPEESREPPCLRRDIWKEW